MVKSLTSPDPTPSGEQGRQEQLRRTSFVWTIYMLLGLFSFAISMIGPMVPYLQDETGMSYTLAGLHQSSFALGMITMGLFGGRLVSRNSIQKSLWGGMVLMVTGLSVMVSGRGPFFSLSGVFVMSLGGTLSLSAIQTCFAIEPRPVRRQFIMEANVVASIMTMLVPLVLLAGSVTFLGWRIVLPVMVLCLFGIASFGVTATGRRLRVHHDGLQTNSGKLKAAYWRIWLVMFLGVSVEWAIGFWCMTYLLGLPGNSRETAAVGTMILGLSSVLGRFAASRISNRISERRMLYAVLIIIALGFPAYWLRAGVASAFAGLALCGFASANLYPLGFSMAIGAAPNNPARASSMAPVASGVAVGLAPLLLGRLADATDMSLALLYVPIGMAAMLAVLLVDKALGTGRQ
jgi:fucose permease